MPTVSVVIPTYNRSHVILNALQSVLAQTYTDYEIIVVDDGSTDDTVERLKPYMNQIRYVYQENQGASAAQNKGVELASGNWIAILASDDLWLPTKLEKELNALTRMGGEFGACFTNCSFFGDQSLSQSAFDQAGFSAAESGPLSDMLKWLFTQNPIVFVQSLMISRSILEARPFDEKMVVAEDTDLIFRLALTTKFCFVNEVLVKIDRTPHRGALTEMFLRMDERAFSAREHMYKKWLGLDDKLTAGTRRRVSDDLRGLYYDWAVSKLYRLHFVRAFNKAKLLRECEDSWTKIIRKLLVRAFRKTRTTFQSSRVFGMTAR